MIASILCALLPVALAGPTTLIQQGRLLGGTGEPLDGQHSVTFAIYDASGVAVWSETDSVALSGGYYVTVLGDTSPLHDLDFANGELTLGIQVGDGPELSPRAPFGSVARALRGPVNISDDGAETPCHAGSEGTLRYRAGAVQVCDGQSWSGLTGSSGSSSGSCEAPPLTVGFTGADQTVTVPEGCTRMRIHAWGAGGAGGYDGSPGGLYRTGGAGGYTAATFPAAPGASLLVVVGGAGQRNTGAGNHSYAYGFGGAAFGYSTSLCAIGGGGGLSGVFTGNVSANNAVLIAGGGGGSSGYTWAGNGNDPTHGGGESSLQGGNGTGIWDAGGGGGYNGGSVHTRSTTNASYTAGEGGTGWVAPLALAGTQQNASAPWQSRQPPGVVLDLYPGSGTEGAAAVGFGGLGGEYGENCDTAGHGAVVFEWLD